MNESNGRGPCPTTRIKNQFGPGYAIKNTADLTDADDLWIDPAIAKADKAAKAKAAKAKAAAKKKADAKAKADKAEK